MKKPLLSCVDSYLRRFDLKEAERIASWHMLVLTIIAIAWLISNALNQ